LSTHDNSHIDSPIRQAIAESDGVEDFKRCLCHKPEGDAPAQSSSAAAQPIP